ncbi:MAG: acylphosphatase [Ignavibacteriales bacterium]|nr:acylphosphatase [Ignavibacteriales bacterium]MBK7378323.1 acylphosphatase [Ignavibacteriales bacterium]
MNSRAIITVSGVVQGVGFRYFVYRTAIALKLKGFTKNLYTGQVLTVVEGEDIFVKEMINKIKIGPPHASVKNCNVSWEAFKNEFESFEIQS